MSQHLTILQASEKFPTSKAHCFQLKGQNPNVYYFRINEPKFLNIGKIRCYVKCVKFDKVDGYLVVTNVPIKNGNEVIALTIKNFTDLVISKQKELLLDKEKNHPKLIPYENLGFLKPNTLNIIYKKTKKVLAKSNGIFNNP